MAVDVSTLSIKVVSSGIDDSTAKLDKLSTSADKAEVATKKFSTSSSSSYQAVTKELQNLQRVANTTSIVPSSSGTAAAVAEIKMVTNAIANVGTQSKKTADESKNAFQAIGGSIANLRTLLGGGLIMGSLIGMSSSIIEMADSWKMMHARLKMITDSSEAATKAQNDLTNSALRLRVPLEGLVQLYTRAIPAMKQYNYSAKDAMAVTTGVAAALKVSGATGAEASSVMLQFSQSLNAGRLNGAEFNAVAEGAPIILRALGAELGKTRAELKAMGAAGTLDIQKLVDVIKKIGPEWEAMTSELPLTFDSAMINIRTSFTRTIGEMDARVGVVGAFASALMLVAKNANIVANIIGTALVAGISYYIAKSLVAIQTSIEATLAKKAEIAINLQLAESEAAAAAAKLATVRAQYLGMAQSPAVIAATERMALANTNLAATQAAAAGGASVLTRALAFLSNPIVLITGLLTLGVLAWINWGDEAAESAEKAANSIMRVRNNLAEFNAEQAQEENMLVQAQIAELDKKIALQQKYVRGEAIFAGKGGAELANDWFRLMTPGDTGKEEYLNKLINERKQLYDTLKISASNASRAAIENKEKEIEAENARNQALGKALMDKSDKQYQWQKKKDEIIAEEGMASKGMLANDPRRDALAEQLERRLAAHEKLNPQLIEEEKNRSKAAKAARAQAAAQARIEAKTRSSTEAQNAYSNAMQSVTDFQDKLNESEVTHKSLLIDIANKSRQAVDDINQKTAAIEAERKGTILTAAAKIAMDAQEKQASVEALDAKIREQEVLRENSSMTLLDAKRNYDAQVERIRQIGEATDAESQQARAAAINQLQFYQGEIKKHTAINQTIEALTAQAKGTEDVIKALDAQAFSQAMLDMEKVGRSLSETLTEGFGEAAKSLGNLINVFDVFSKQQQKLDSDRAVAKEKAGDDTAKLAQVEKAYVKAKVAMETKAYGDIAKSAKGFFKEHTTGYKVMDATEKAFRAMEIAMAAKSTMEKLGGIAKEIAAQGPLNYLKAQAAVLTQGEGDPYTAFARMAAMAAFVASIGMSVGGSGGTDTTAQDRQEAAGTGSILGDAKAKSESISHAMDVLVNNSELSNEYNAGMLASLKNIEAAMTGVATLAIKSGVTSVNFQESLGGVAGFASGLLGKIGLGALGGKILGGIFGGKKTLQDFGITAKSASLQDILSGDLNLSKYTDIKRSGGLFRKDKVSRTLENVPEEMTNQFTMVISGLYDSVQQAGKALGMESGLASKLQSFVVDIGSISLKDMSAEDIQKQFSNIFSKVGDDMAKYALPALEKYQKIGEGYFETLVRVASNIATLDGLFLSIGIDSRNAFGLITESAIDAKMQLIEFAGGLDNLSKSLGAYYDKYYTDAEKQKLVADQVGAKLASMGLNVMAGADEATTLANFRKLVEQQNLGTESGRRAYAALLEIAPTFADLAGKLAANELLGVGQTIPQAQMDAANAWWEAKGGPAAIDTQTLIADGITNINDTGAKDKTIADMATANATNQAATIETLKQVVMQQQATNNILMAKIDSLTLAVAESGKRVVNAVVDTSTSVTR